MATLKYKNGNNWEGIKIPEPVSLAGMCYVALSNYNSPANTYGGTWSRIQASGSNVVFGSWDSSGYNSFIQRTSNSGSSDSYARCTMLYIWLRTD